VDRPGGRGEGGGACVCVCVWGGGGGERDGKLGFEKGFGNL
jgi:hypothetical protein